MKLIFITIRRENHEILFLQSNEMLVHRLLRMKKMLRRVRKQRLCVLISQKTYCTPGLDIKYHL